MFGYKVPHGLPGDTKLAVIAKRRGMRRGEILALWVLLLDHASRNTPRGAVHGMDAEEAAAALDFDVDAVAGVLKDFHERGLISADGFLLDWDKNQTASSTMRTREYRARQNQKDRVPQDSPLSSPDDDSEEEAALRRQRLQAELISRHKRRGRRIAQKDPS